jgi:hypothetical protein
MIRRTSHAILLGLALCGPLDGRAQEPAQTRSDAQPCLLTLEQLPADAPKFADFPAPAFDTVKPVPIDLSSSPEARRYRTMLREGSKDGPNFAGTFTIVGWGCGSACIEWAIVDAKTGKVFFDPRNRIVSVDDVDDPSGHPNPDSLNTGFFGLRFNRESALLAILGAPGEDTKREGVSFYRWTGHMLEQVRFYPAAALCTAKGSPGR